MTVELSSQKGQEQREGERALSMRTRLRQGATGMGRASKARNARAVDKTAHTQSESEEGGYGRTMCGHRHRRSPPRGRSKDRSPSVTALRLPRSSTSCAPELNNSHAARRFTRALVGSPSPEPWSPDICLQLDLRSTCRQAKDKRRILAYLRLLTPPCRHLHTRQPVSASPILMLGVVYTPMGVCGVLLRIGRLHRLKANF